MDKGMNIREIEGLFDTAGEYVDIVKLGWGTSYVTNNLEKKIALYRSFDTPIVCGGTLFEAVYVRGKLDAFKPWLEHYRFSHVEISDGTVDIPRERKLELIADFARDFTVLSEVGSKDSEVVFAPYQWVEWIKEETRRGRVEGDHGGARGRHRRDLPQGRRHAHGADRRDRSRDRLPRPDLGGAVEGSQAWFVKHFGPEVNLGNIAPEEVIPLETLRLGLRGDTLKEILLADEPAATP